MLKSKDYATCAQFSQPIIELKFALHSCFRPVPTVKLLGLMLRNRCWPTTFHTITTRDVDGWCYSRILLKVPNTHYSKQKKLKKETSPNPTRLNYPLMLKLKTNIEHIDLTLATLYRDWIMYSKHANYYGLNSQQTLMYYLGWGNLYDHLLQNTSSKSYASTLRHGGAC